MRQYYQHLPEVQGVTQQDTQKVTIYGIQKLHYDISPAILTDSIDILRNQKDFVKSWYGYFSQPLEIAYIELSYIIKLIS